MIVDMTTPTTVDEYLTTLTDEKRAAMEQIRAACRAAAPGAAEVITYNMPGFKTHGQFLVSYDAYKSHYSLFPASDEVVKGLGAETEPHLAGSGTIRFKAKRPDPGGPGSPDSSRSAWRENDARAKA